MAGGNFIESPSFPVREVSEASQKEKQGGGRPPHWEMVFWWTRKPLAGARAVVAASLLPSDVDPRAFKLATRLKDPIPHRSNPALPPEWRERLSKARLLDPFAGFGSIPLEAARLGVGEVVAVELLPTAYVFLKAVLEYPRWASARGVKLADEVERWGRWILDELKKEVADLYDEDTAVYIGTWEVKCPHCGRYTPLVGNWWLARVTKGSQEEGEEEEEGTRRGTYTRLAWMEPIKTQEHVGIRIIDLNTELRQKAIRATVNSRQGTVKVGDRTYHIPRKNIDPKRETAICLLCNHPIANKQDNTWYVKAAIKDWNTKWEEYLTGKIDLQTLKTAKARPRLLAKAKTKNGELQFEPTTEEDQQKLWNAAEKLRQIWGDPDIPTEPISPYANRYLFPILYGFDKWFKLFNPRQLYTLVKLVKLIREAGRRAEEEKIRQGWPQEEARKYAEAVTTYLAIALANFADNYAYTTYWENTWLMLKRTMAFRGIAMTWNWCDVNPGIKITGSLIKSFENITNGLSYLVSAVSGSPGRVRVVLGDAAEVDGLGVFDAVVTDPPYADDVPYAELSDFYYVWLKRALSGVEDVGGVLVRVPRFLSEAFYVGGVEVETQWRMFAPREVSEDEGRGAFFGTVEVGGRRVAVGSFDYFKALLGRSFEAMARAVSDSGVVVTYYAHTSPDAWEALLEAGWRRGRMRVVAAHALATESGQRVTARGKAALDVSIVVAWRKGVSGRALADEVYGEAVRMCVERVRSLRGAGLAGGDLFVGGLGCVLSVFTRYEEVVGVRSLEELVERFVYPAAGEAVARALGGELASRLSPPSLFYLLAKALLGRRGRQRRRMDRSGVVVLSIGTRNDVDRLRELKLVFKNNSEFQLAEPVDVSEEGVRELLEERGVLREGGKPALMCGVDVAHYLEYLAVRFPRDQFLARVEELRGEVPALYEEGVGLLRALVSVLPTDEPERRLGENVLTRLGMHPVWS